MTTFTSYSLVPELQHAFNKFILESEINKYQMPTPVNIPELYLTENSFINMLFKDEYNLSNYSYLYLDETNPFFIPQVASSRLQIYPGIAKYLIMDSATGSNIFNLQADDFTMLDALLVYRNDSTALTIIDSTSETTLITDATNNTSILFTEYNILSTELSKMIYLYLDLKIYERYINYNNQQIISTGGLLQTCYEAYLTEQFYLFIKQNKPNLIYNTCEVS